jgi:hypothetical protein
MANGLSSDRYADATVKLLKDTLHGEVIWVEEPPPVLLGAVPGLVRQLKAVVEGRTLFLRRYSSIATAIGSAVGLGDRYELVLKGHAAVDDFVFPQHVALRDLFVAADYKTKRDVDDFINSFLAHNSQK